MWATRRQQKAPAFDWDLLLDILARRPGLEPGTYRLTVEPTPFSIVATLKIPNAFFCWCPPDPFAPNLSQTPVPGISPSRRQNSNFFNGIALILIDRQEHRLAGRAPDFDAAAAGGGGDTGAPRVRPDGPVRPHVGPTRDR